jgi:four helix bundle protein
MIQSYKDLEVWRRGIEISVRIYEMTRCFPRSELYGLTGQMRNSSVSVPANIAEGYGRGSVRAYVNFLRTSRGSLNELETQLIIASRLKYIDNESFINLIENTNELGKMLNSLIKKLTPNA